MRSKIISTAHMTGQLFLSRSKNDKPEVNGRSAADSAGLF